MAHIEGYLGRITNKLEIRKTSKGTSLLNFSLANDEGWGDNKRTDFIPCVCFNKTADIIANNFHKGDSIIVSGKWQNSPYQKNDKGYDIPNWQYIVNNITFLPKPKATEFKPNTNDGFTPVNGSQLESLFESTATEADFAPISDDSSDLPF